MWNRYSSVTEILSALLEDPTYICINIYFNYIKQLLTQSPFLLLILTLTFYVPIINQIMFYIFLAYSLCWHEKNHR